MKPNRARRLMAFEVLEQRLVLSSTRALAEVGTGVLAGRAHPPGLSMRSHPGAARERLATVRHGPLFVYTPTPPISTYTVTGDFDPNATTTVRFIDKAGVRMNEVPSSVTATSIDFALPFYNTPRTLHIRQGGERVVIVQTDASGVTHRTLGLAHLQIAALPQTNLPAGTVTRAFLTGMQSVIQGAIQDYQGIAAASQGTVDVSPLVANLQATSNLFQREKDAIAPLISGQVSQISLGTTRGIPIVLNRESLALSDRIIAAGFAGAGGGSGGTNAGIASSSVLIGGPGRISTHSTALGARGLISARDDGDLAIFNQMTNGVLSTYQNTFSDAYKKTTEIFQSIASSSLAKAGLFVLGAATATGVISATSPFVIAGATFGALYLTTTTFIPAYESFVAANAGRTAGVGGQSASDFVDSLKPLGEAYAERIFEGAKDVFKDVVPDKFPKIGDALESGSYFKDLADIGKPNTPISEIVNNYDTIQKNLNGPTLTPIPTTPTPIPTTPTPTPTTPTPTPTTPTPTPTTPTPTPTTPTPTPTTPTPTPTTPTPTPTTPPEGTTYSLSYKFPDTGFDFTIGPYDSEQRVLDEFNKTLQANRDAWPNGPANLLISEYQLHEISPDGKDQVIQDQKVS